MVKETHEEKMARYALEKEALMKHGKLPELSKEDKELIHLAMRTMPEYKNEMAILIRHGYSVQKAINQCDKDAFEGFMYEYRKDPVIKWRLFTNYLKLRSKEV